MLLSDLSRIRTAVVFRGSSPQEEPQGNVRAIAIRDLVASGPVSVEGLPLIQLDEKYLSHCLRHGDIVMPSRGDYYKAWCFEGAEQPVFPLGQLNIISVNDRLDARYLTWYLNQPTTQARIGTMLTGTNIKALTKAGLSTLEVDVPGMESQRQIAELEHTLQQIAATRHRLTEIDKAEVAYLTQIVLQRGLSDA